jgi:starvation-inducible outer membrane lipoprotein
MRALFLMAALMVSACASLPARLDPATAIATLSVNEALDARDIVARAHVAAGEGN